MVATSRSARPDEPTPVAVFVSFRLGGSDGVSIESEKWAGALRRLGFTTRRVAGEIARPDAHDRVVPALGIEPVDRADPAETQADLEDALDGADLVVVENLLSLPLNLPAARALTGALRTLDPSRTRVVLHHHDLPWQRERFWAVTELPPNESGWVHVTINDRSRADLAERDIEAATVRNRFDLDPHPGNRDATRRAVGVETADVLVLHPVRAIARKNVPTALELCRALTIRLDRCVRYWLPGPPEEGYGPELAGILADAGVPVVRDPVEPMADAYAACDLVVFPSRWEGFGNPVVESVAHRRPLAVASYPVLDELRALGLEFLSVDDPEAVAAVLSGAVDMTETMERNLSVARRHLSLHDLPRVLARAIEVPSQDRP